MRFLDGMKVASAPCPWYAKAKASTRKRHSGWLRQVAVEKYFQQHYAKFDKTMGNFTVPPGLSSKRKLDWLMMEFYLHPNADLHKELHERRHNHGLTECPYCGNPLIPDTLDHFLPKDDWPEYSILANNLVPQCRSCAPIKGSRYYSTDALCAMFMHPMYCDALASVRFKIDISFPATKPIFEIEFSAAEGTAPTDVARIVLHLKKLEVKRRMLSFCVRHWSHWREKVQTRGIDIDALFRLQLGPMSIGEYGRDWATAFMKGVLRDAEALAALNAKPATLALPAERLIKLDVE